MGIDMKRLVWTLIIACCALTVAAQEAAVTGVLAYEDYNDRYAECPMFSSGMFERDYLAYHDIPETRSPADELVIGEHGYSAIFFYFIHTL